MKTKLLTGSLFAAVILGMVWFFTRPVHDSLIAADNDYIQYTGRVDFSDPAAPQISWPGSMIQANFTGTSVAVVMSDQYAKNYFNVFIDSKWDGPVVIKGEKGKTVYPIAADLSPGAHSVTLTKRTEGEQGATIFYGLVMADGGHLLPPPVRPERRIEFFGDSITSGMGNEAPEYGADDVLREKNSFLTYAAIAARDLNAEYVLTAQSGVGLVTSYVGYTMQDYFDQLSAVGDNDTQWDFSAWVPDVVVINLFQNDRVLIRERLNPPPTDEQLTEVYRDFVERIRATYPQAYIICTLGPMDAAMPGTPWAGYVRGAVESIKAETNDKKIDVLIFEFKHFYKHPRVRHHQENAAVLAAYIREKMDW